MNDNVLSARMQKLQNYRFALKDCYIPTLCLDLNYFEENLTWAKNILGTTSGKTIRIATKSIRSLPILKKILASSSIYQGLMTYSLNEALWLKNLGFKNILMGYPTVDIEALNQLAKDPAEIILMVDLPEHLDLLEGIAKKNNNIFQICIDIDLSLDLPGVRFGVYRSQLHDLKIFAALLEKIKKCPHLKLTGLMGYEAQIAGVGDKKDFIVQLLRKISIPNLRKRRKQMVQMIQDQGFALTLVNGGGTGSLHSTKEEHVVTEVTVGSGFYSPGLFDYYQDFLLKPAMFFALPITRHPQKNIFTCFGGGYIASGSLDKKKLPQPYLPTGMKLLKHEGAGEVQTPFKYCGNENLQIGDLVFFRHAKAAEITERFFHIHLIRGDQCEDKVLTYRGEGKSFG